MDEDYDLIVLGTGFKECILSGLMSVNGKKVLHMDRNSYYGGESASLNLEQLYEKFRGKDKPPKELGRSRDYCVDLCPKFLMACGDLVKVLVHTKVFKYLEFKSVIGSFVLQSGKIHKVPATASEAIASGLLGIFQKRRYKNFLDFVSKYDEKDPKTWDGNDLAKMSTRELFEKYSLAEETQQFTGHAVALECTDDYLTQPAGPTVEAIKLYAYSVLRYGNSPYIYPHYGLGGLPEGFSRLSAIHGGVYMLNKPIAEILYNDDGTVKGVKDTEGAVARCKQLIADPSYFLGSSKIACSGRIIRCICLLSHPIPNTSDSESCQIIIPFHQLKRRNDVYIFSVSYHHKVVAQGKWIAVVSTNVETDNASQEILPALSLLGSIDEKFEWVSDYYRATNDGTKDNCFITSSYDAQSHFESATVEVINMYEKIAGKKLDLTQQTASTADQE